MIINEVRPHDTIGVANWRALQSAVNKKSAATLQHSDTTKTYSEQQTAALYRWAKLHLNRNEQHAVFDKLASAEKIAQLLPNLPLREVAASKTKYSRNEDGLKNWVEIQRAVRHSSSNPSDPRHSARLSVGDQQAVLSKSDAERLFRWLKSKFRTKKERDLFEFLGSTQLLDMLKTSLTEKWSAKYKRSIDCSHPKGFSQRAHCAGRKKHNEDTLNELAPSEPRGGDNRPERPLSLVDVAKIIKANLGPDWTMERVGRTEQPGYKFIPTDKTKHGMAKIWCLVDWHKVGEYPTYNTILYSYQRADGKIIANGRQTERAKHKSVSNALETARLILNNKGGLKDAVTEGMAEGSWTKPKFNTDTVIYNGPKEKGISIFSAGYHPDVNTAWIEAIKSDEPGAGRNMIRTFEQWAKSQGAKTINAEALVSSLEFWKKMGFSVAGKPSNKNRIPIQKNISQQGVAEGMSDYSDEEIERYGPELIQRQRNLDLLDSVFGYQNIHRVARALRAGNLKRRLRHNEGTPEERAQYSRAVRILDSMTDESGNIMPHTDTTVYRQK